MNSVAPDMAGAFVFWWILGRYGKMILASGLAAGVLAAVLTLTVMEPRYGADAILVIKKERLALAFDPKITSLPAEVDLNSRARSLERIAGSPYIANLVLEQVRSRLRPEQQELSRFHKVIRTSATGESLEIHASLHEPKLAADVANAWARTVEARMNLVYSKIYPTQEVTLSQFDEARKRYEEAQKALETFTEKEDRASAVDASLQAKRLQVQNRHRGRERMLRALEDAEALLVECRGQGAGSPTIRLARRLAVILLRAPLALDATDPGSAPLPVQLTVDGGAPALGEEALAADLEQLRDRLRERAQRLDRDAQDPALANEILRLQGQLEQLQGKRRELAGARDVAWDTHTVLARKLAETRLAVNLGEKVLEVAAEATPNDKPESPLLWLNVLAASVAGLVLGMVGVCLGPARALVFGMPLRAAETASPASPNPQTAAT